MKQSNSKPRWINEIPGIKDNGKKRKLTKQEKKEVKEFRDAIKNNKIDEWFNEDKNSLNIWKYCISNSSIILITYISIFSYYLKSSKIASFPVIEV